MIYHNIIYVSICDIFAISCSLFAVTLCVSDCVCQVFKVKNSCIKYDPLGITGLTQCPLLLGMRIKSSDGVRLYAVPGT